jgi:hypothetical protein
MSLRGRIQRSGRLNFILSVLVLVFFLWQQLGQVGISAASALLAVLASLCGAAGGWIGWKKERAHKRFTRIKQVCSRTQLVLSVLNNG